VQKSNSVLDRPLCTLKVNLVNLLVFAQLLFWETKTNFKVPQIVTHITFVSVMLAYRNRSRT